MLYSSWLEASSSAASPLHPAVLPQPSVLAQCLSGRVADLTYLASGIDNLGCIVLPFVANDLAERVLDSGIVALDEVTVYELDRERGLACAGG